MTPLLVTPGDPLGVGYELALQAVHGRPAPARPTVLLGDPKALGHHSARLGLPLTPISSLGDAEQGGVAYTLAVSEGVEPVEVRALRDAVAACLNHTGAALVTGPIHKARLAAQGFHHPGHTTFLGELCGVHDPVMAFVGGDLRVVLVTVHLPLSAVPAAVTPERILHTVRTAHQALTEQVGLASPRLLVCGLNPHAGDDGTLGTEEQTVIGPACNQARAEGLHVQGPVSAETAFLLAGQGKGDMVVAMYHDQGLAPLKAVDFGRSVNWTLGLPIIRTSVDHGTADHLVGTGEAKPHSFIAALSWADTLADQRA